MLITDEMLMNYADKKLTDTVEIVEIEMCLANDPELMGTMIKLQASKILMDYMKEVLKHGRK